MKKMYQLGRVVVLALIPTLLLSSCGNSDRDRAMQEVAQIDRELVELNVRIAQYGRVKDANAVSGIINVCSGEWGSAAGNVAIGEGLSREADVLYSRRSELLMRRYQLVMQYNL